MITPELRQRMFMHVRRNMYGHSMRTMARHSVPFAMGFYFQDFVDLVLDMIDDKDYTWGIEDGWEGATENTDIRYNWSNIKDLDSYKEGVLDGRLLAEEFKKQMIQDLDDWKKTHHWKEAYA